MKIIFSEIKKGCNDLDWEGKYLRENLADHECVFVDSVLNDYKEDVSEFEALSTFIHTQVNADLLDRMPNLKLIATRSTGFDHIDLTECEKRGIKVTNVPSYGENTVAEYAFALLLTLARQIYNAYDRTIKSNYSLEGLIGFDLQGKVMGVVGGGKIGQHTIKIAKGFGMKVLVFDVTKNDELAQELGFEYVELDRLYELSDVISLHVPLIPPTKHMINAEAFAKMKDGVILINTARGGVVDTNALIQALETGKLGGAGLDVLEGEEWLADELNLVDEEKDIEKIREALANHIMMDNPKVIVTFHNAFNTVEGITRILATTVANIESYQKGQVVREVKKK